MVNGTLASEFRTRFCPIRLTYSLITGSCTKRAVCSTIMAYCLPILISVSVEYQSPKPRPPTFRLPMASTSFLLPLFTPAGVAPVESESGWLETPAEPAGCITWLLSGFAGVVDCWVSGAVAAGGGALDGACVFDCAAAGTARQKLSDHAMNTEPNGTFMGYSIPRVLAPRALSFTRHRPRRAIQSRSRVPSSAVIICPIGTVNAPIFQTYNIPTPITTQSASKVVTDCWQLPCASGLEASPRSSGDALALH